jgi:hypothetical protein
MNPLFILYLICENYLVLIILWAIVYVKKIGISSNIFPKPMKKLCFDNCEILEATIT